MTAYLRVDADGVAVERLEYEGDISEVYHPDVVSTLVEASGDADVGWICAGGSWSPPDLQVADLDTIKASLKTGVDLAAEDERAKYITPGSGQAMTYQQKASEAVMLEDDPAPDPADYPLLLAEVGITAPTLAEVGVVVRQAHGAWILLGAQIEAVRLGAKKAIDEAETPEAATTAATVVWPQPAP